MTVGHMLVIIFMLITAGFIVWLEMNSRKNTPKSDQQRKDRANREIAEGGSR